MKSKNNHLLNERIKALEPQESPPISAILEDNLAVIEELFAKCSDLVVRKLRIFGTYPGAAVYLDGLVDGQLWDSGLLEPILLQSKETDNTRELQELLMLSLASTDQPQLLDTIGGVVQRMVRGEVILLAESCSRAFSFALKDQLHRQLEEPTTEAIIRGPRFGFIEKLDINIAILRQRIRSPLMKVEKLCVGKLSQTDVAVVYIENLADSKIIDDVKQRINSIDMDSVLESGYIEEMISDHPFTPFPVMQSTQRPDTVSGSLVEGKVAVIVDGSPMVLVLPITFWFGFQTAEDYYMNFILATMLRWLRFMFAFLAMALPAIYIAITSFQQEMIPTSLALSLAAAREVVPFPVMGEALIMEITFEALREAGIRLPRPVGQTISIVGALVIGQAAVQAGIISAPMIIVVSTTGIASFLIPNPNMSQAISIIRFPLMVMGATFGLYGVSVGLIAILIHVANLTSFGVPYLTPIAPFNRKGLLDTVTRAPWRVLWKRYMFNKRRLE